MRLPNMDGLPITNPTTDGSSGEIEQLPEAVSGLINGAVATFDSDREASRRYLQRASVLLRVRVQVELRKKTTMRGLPAWQINRLFDHIQAHVGEKISRHELAKLLHMSVGRLSMRFKVSTGMTLRQYIARQRVENACGMMKSTDESLSWIAIACGLCDQAHFSRVFRRVLGVSPAAWRRANTTVKLAGTWKTGPA
jgi:AraC family transcriptional regulator